MAVSVSQSPLTVVYSRGYQRCIDSRRSASDDSLANKTHYRIRVRAEVSAGGSEAQTYSASVFGLSTFGMLETGYLAYNSLSGQDVACPVSSCNTVLTSSYAMLWDTVPLSLLGCIVYGSVAVMSGILAMNDGLEEPQLVKKGILLGSTLLVSSSAYLAYLLSTVFSETPCPWCMVSIGLSMGIGALVVKSSCSKDLKDSVMPGAGLVFSTVFLLSLGLGNASDASGSITRLEYKNPVVTTESSEKAISLARRLKADGAKMYGAFWCSHCYEQKQDFGAQAMKEFPYVECFPDGWSQGVSIAKICTELPGGKPLNGFPTWVIGNERFEGEQSFDALEAALDEFEKQ
jgi:uncharacterized membrane protein